MNIKNYARLEEVQIDDIDLLYEWVNDSECRKNAFYPEKIDYDVHRSWFLNRINSDKTIMYIYIIGEEKIGQTRIDIRETVGYISYSIKKEARGKGYGFNMLELLENKVKEDNININYLIGEVKKDNLPSQKVFQNLKYSQEIKEDYMLFKKKL